MPVEFVAFEGEKDVARFCLTRVGADIFNSNFPGAGFDFRPAGLGYKFQRTFFHKIISAKIAEHGGKLQARGQKQAGQHPETLRT